MPTNEIIADSLVLVEHVLAGLPRFQNLVEGWHNGFQKLVGCSNPTLWTLLTALKKEDLARDLSPNVGSGG